MRRGGRPKLTVADYFISLSPNVHSEVVGAFSLCYNLGHEATVKPQGIF